MSTDREFLQKLSEKSKEEVIVKSRKYAWQRCIEAAQEGETSCCIEIVSWAASGVAQFLEQSKGLTVTDQVVTDISKNTVIIANWKSES